MKAQDRGDGSMHKARLAASIALAAFLTTSGMGASGAVPVPIAAGEYELTTETVLPHLEEALRYATTRTRNCLRAPDAESVFPLLRHQAFTGCGLLADPDASDGLHFGLHCANPEAATGTAVFTVDESHVSAVLQVKMGGKNMTLSQRVHGPRVGSCSQ